MDDERLYFCLNNIKSFQINDSILDSLFLKQFNDEVRIFTENYFEALSDNSVGAHMMLPTTPGPSRTRQKLGDEHDTEHLPDNIKLSVRPPKGEGRGKKRQAAPSRVESRCKRVSIVSETPDGSSIMSDISINSQPFDLSSITSQLDNTSITTSEFPAHRVLRSSRKKDQETVVPYFTRQRSLRTRKKPVPETQSSVEPAPEQQQPPCEVTRRISLVTGTKLSAYPHVSYTVSGSEEVASDATQQRDTESVVMVVEDVEMKSPEISLRSLPCYSISSTPPERPAPPSSTYLESSVSVLSTPPPKPSPPAMASSQINSLIPGTPIATQSSTGSAPDVFLSLIAEQSISDQTAPEPISETRRSSVVILQDSLDQTNQTTVTNFGNYLREDNTVILVGESLTHTPPQTSDNINAKFVTPSFIQTSLPHDSPSSDILPPLPTGNRTNSNTPSITHTSSKPRDNPITSSDTPTSSRPPVNPPTDLYTPRDTHTSPEVFTSVVGSPDPVPALEHTRNIAETPEIPLPTPSKTFSVHKRLDSDLCVTPPNEIGCKTSKPYSRPAVESPLLEQHPDPSLFLSTLEQHPQESVLTPANQRPAQLPAGRTHTVQKKIRVPSRNNTPSKFHSKCSPHSNPLATPHTPPQRSHLGTPTGLSPNRKCRVLLSKNIASSHPVMNIPPILSASSKLKKNTHDTTTSSNQSVFLSPSSSLIQMTNSSIQNIPKGLVSNMAGKFQPFLPEKQPGRLAFSISTFLKKKPTNPPVKNSEETKLKIEQKHHEGERRVGGLMVMKQKLLDKKKQENTKRQQEVAERRAELLKKQREKVHQRLDSKEEKMKQWERQSMRRKKAEEERLRREESDRKRAEEKRQLEKTHVKTSHSENASTTFNTSSFMSSTQSHNDVTSYRIDDLDSENTDDEDHPRHPVPSWATEPYLMRRLHFQSTGSALPDVVFPSCQLLQPMDLTLVFEYNRYRRCKRPYNYRTSSAHWTSPMWKPS